MSITEPQSDPPSAKRGWHRFKLRRLVLSVFAIYIGLIVGLIATSPRGLAKIKRLGGLVTVDDKAADGPVTHVLSESPRIADADAEQLAALSQLRRLELPYSKLTDKGLKHLAGLSQLEELDLTSTFITDSGLEHIAGMGRLESLNLTATALTDSGLERIGQLPQLHNLYVGYTQITDDGLDHIRKLDHLEDLSLSEDRVSDGGLARLKGLNQLRSLYLAGTQITDAGLQHLQDLTQLKRLYLSRTRVTDAGLQYLQGLPELDQLDLSQTQVTDAGLPHLEKLPRLIMLDLSESQVTGPGVENLRQARPNCIIQWNPPSTTSSEDGGRNWSFNGFHQIVGTNPSDPLVMLVTMVLWGIGLTVLCKAKDVVASSLYLAAALVPILLEGLIACRDYWEYLWDTRREYVLDPELYGQTWSDLWVQTCLGLVCAGLVVLMGAFVLVVRFTAKKWGGPEIAAETATKPDQAAKAHRRRFFLAFSAAIPSAIGAILAFAVMCAGDRLWSDDLLLGGLWLLLTSVGVFWASGIRRLPMAARLFCGLASCVLIALLFHSITEDEVPYSWRKSKIWPPDHGASEMASRPKIPWIANDFQPGDELWWFSTPAPNWRHLGGESGQVLIRNGKTVKKKIFMIN